MKDLLVRALAAELEAEKVKAEVKVLNRALVRKAAHIKKLYKAIVENNKVIMLDFHRNIEKAFNVEG